MDFLANENFPLASIRLLRQSGHRVVSIIQEVPGSKDRDILSRACAEKLVILTFDRDYGELIYRYKSTPPAGVVYLRFAPMTPDEPGEIMLNIIGNKNLSLINHFTIVERGRIRQRTLQRAKTLELE